MLKNKHLLNPSTQQVEQVFSMKSNFNSSLLVRRLSFLQFQDQYSQG